jgi:DNA segregation ATPase FtsK/SpoIIIE-like protein
VGVDLAGKLLLGDLAETKNTHFLVVGTTGSGKSEWLRTAIAGLLIANTPETLQLVLIDPKRNAFDQLTGSPFLHEGRIVYPDEHSVLETFQWMAEETERRFRRLQQTGTDDLKALVKHTGVHTPRVVCVCDEYGDLVRGSDKRTRDLLELQITRLGSKARAAGVHLIIATQEARRETIRGSLDANIPARVGLRVLKDIESRLLLQQNGAEKLLGHGDLLFKDIGAPVRLQAPLLSKDEREIIFASGVIGRSRAS